jgi:hypothetical protein
MRFEAHIEMTRRERAAVRLALLRFGAGGVSGVPAWSMAARDTTSGLDANAARLGARSAWQAARDRKTWPDRPWRRKRERPATR